MTIRPSPDESYQRRVAIEQQTYRDQSEDMVHSLPPIFHYWSNKYLRPKLEQRGFRDDHAVFAHYLAEQCTLPGNGVKRFASIGSGNCDLELALAAQLHACGRTNFTIDCLDLNPEMLERGSAAAEGRGLQGSIRCVQVDINEWKPECEYDAVIANQALHHVLKLEELFDRIKDSLTPGGYLVTSDIIGRNGHLRWPEALEIVREFWRKLPPSYRFNRQVQRYEEMFEDWDCSNDCFEGIRAQDILPLLLDRFHFNLFYAFANVVEPFIDRSFGYNFDAGAEWDRKFIDEVHRRDEEEISRGRISPTHMIAVLGKRSADRALDWDGLTPEFCVRRGVAPATKPQPPQSAYEWDAWPHDPHVELEKTCGLLRAAEERVKRRAAEVAEYEDLVGRFRTELDRANADVEERTKWALDLDRTVKAEWERVANLTKEVDARTEWAVRLEKELEELSWARKITRIVEAIRRYASRLVGRGG